MTTNLISNAIKYSPADGKISFEVVRKENNIFIKVSNQGKGISKDNQKLIFEKFERGENVDNIPGSGLGLSIVEKSVELHNGSIDVTSDVNKGAIFLITIPINNKMGNEEDSYS